MQAETFNKLVEDMVEETTSLLISKNAGYNDGGDKLESFKKAAALQGITPKEALRGMWAKHVVSISDMLASEKVFPIEVWQEKLGDNINYSILAMGLEMDFRESLATFPLDRSHPNN